MKRCLSISFDYKGKEYFAIVRHRSVDKNGFYHVRIMNHRLDALINKNNLSIIPEQDGVIQITEAESNSEDSILHASIVRELLREIGDKDDGNEFVHISEYPLLTPF